MLIAIFRSRTRPGVDAEAEPLRARVQEIAEAMPGYISNKTFVAGDGERVSIHYWESEEQLRAHLRQCRLLYRGLGQALSGYVMPHSGTVRGNWLELAVNGQ